MDCIKEEYNYRNTLIEMSDTLLTYKNIIYQKISTITFQAGEVSNKDRQQLSPSLFIGSSLLEMSNLKIKGILDLSNIRYLCAILPFILINSEPNFHRCTNGGFFVFVWMMFVLL